MEQVTVQGADAALFVPEGSGPWPLVVMYMDAGGLRPAFAAMGERLASHGYVVLQPNLYWRSGAYAPLDPHTMFADPGERARLSALMQAVVPAEVVADTERFLTELSRDPRVRDTRRVGLVGYCMGGRLAYVAATKMGDRVAAAAAIHPGGLVTDGRDSPHLGTAQIRGRIYVGAADEDRSLTREHQETLRAALSSAGVAHEVELQPGARHGYAMTDFPVYAPAAAERHWDKIVELFAATLG